MRLMVFVLSLVSAGFACAGEPVMRSETDILKSYAFSQCIARAYPNTKIAADAKAASAGYMEFGNISIEAYSEAVSLAQKTLKKSYRGKRGEPLHVMKCVDFMFSAELALLVEQYVVGRR